MGKKLVIKDADFSANGIKEVKTLKYIKATAATQTIVAPFTPSQKMRMVAEVSLASLGQSAAIFGCGYIGTSSANLCYQNDALGTRSIFYAKSSASLGTVSTSIFDTIDISSGALKINGSSVEIPGDIAAHPEQYSYVGIFGLGGLSIGSVGVGCMLKHIKVYSDYEDDSSLILDAYPVKKTDGTICLYDLVSETYLYTNDGTNPDYEE